jgi:osmoprotectant transport system permease protein
VQVWEHLEHFLASVFGWLTTSSNWTGSTGIPELVWHQLELTAAVVLGAVLIGGGLGLVLGHTGRGGLVAINAANAFRAVPSLSLLTLFAIIPAISLRWDGFLAAFLALLILAIPPILTNTYVGIREVDSDVRDAATAMGLTGGQMLRRVELPLAIPVLMAGVRTASIEVVATSTLAAYVSFSDLGTPIIAGLNTNNTVEAFAGALLVTVLAAAVAFALGAVQRLLTPKPLRRDASGLARQPRGTVVARLGNPAT